VYILQLESTIRITVTPLSQTDMMQEQLSIRYVQLLGVMTESDGKPVLGLLLYSGRHVRFLCPCQRKDLAKAQMDSQLERNK